MTLIGRKYSEIFLKLSKDRNWGADESMISHRRNIITIEFDSIPLVKELIVQNIISPRKDYIYTSPCKTITFDCNSIYMLLKIQMLNIIENYLHNNDLEFFNKLRDKNILIKCNLKELNVTMQYRYSHDKLKIDVPK